MTALRFTDRDLDRLQAAQQALLSSLEIEEPTEWQLRANRAVRRFLDADHSVFSLPTDTIPDVVTDDTDRTFPRRFHDYCLGVFSGGYRFRDPCIQKAATGRRAGGTGAYHEWMLYSREDTERSPAYHELFRPTGLTHMIGLSTPMPVGEATQFFSFEGVDAEADSERAFKRLRLLVPAFEAGVRIHRRLAAQRMALAPMLDRLGQALAVYSTRGVRLHQSRALRELVAGEPDAERLSRLADTVARTLAKRWRSPSKTARQFEAVDVSRRIRTRGAEYRLVGCYLPPDLFGAEGVLVLVERLRPVLPTEAHLRTRLGLTPREAEIALLLAEGLTDSSIAEHLSISPNTARRHSENILKKLRLNSRAAVALALLRESSAR